MTPADAPASAKPSRWAEADRLLGVVNAADVPTPDEVEWMLAHIAWLHGEVDRLAEAAGPEGEQS